MTRAICNPTVPSAGKYTLEKAIPSQRITSPVAGHKVLKKNAKNKLRKGRTNLMDYYIIMIF